MAVTPYKPTTPGRRGMTTADKSAITRKKPVKSLLRVKKSQAGRNNQGRITVRHRGGGVKKFYHSQKVLKQLLKVSNTIQTELLTSHWCATVTTSLTM